MGQTQQATRAPNWRVPGDMHLSLGTQACMHHHLRMPAGTNVRQREEGRERAQEVERERARARVRERDLNAVDAEAVARHVGLRRKRVFDVERVQPVSPLRKVKNKGQARMHGRGREREGAGGSERGSKRGSERERLYKVAPPRGEQTLQGIVPLGA